MQSRSRFPIAVALIALAIAAVAVLRPGSATQTIPPIANAATAAADPGALAPFLRFTGTGTVTVKPDTATITVSAGATAKTSQDALEAATRKLTAVRAKMKELGVADADLQTAGSWTYQEWDTHRWHAELTLNVKVRDITQAGKLLAEANAAGADSVSGPMFAVADQHAAYATALRQAIEDARSKAEAAASQMGVTVSGVVSVDDQGSAGGPVMYARDAAASGVAPGSPTPVPIDPGTQDINATVTVVFSYAR
jgi:uncharacterized protein YggE